MQYFLHYLIDCTDMRDEYYIYSRFFLYKRRMEYNLTIFF